MLLLHPLLPPCCLILFPRTNLPRTLKHSPSVTRRLCADACQRCLLARTFCVRVGREGSARWCYCYARLIVEGCSGHARALMTSIVWVHLNRWTHTYIHTYIHICMHTCVYACIHQESKQTNMHACINTYKRSHVKIPQQARVRRGGGRGNAWCTPHWSHNKQLSDESKCSTTVPWQRNVLHRSTRCTRMRHSPPWEIPVSRQQRERTAYRGLRQHALSISSRWRSDSKAHPSSHDSSWRLYRPRASQRRLPHRLGARLWVWGGSKRAQTRRVRLCSPKTRRRRLPSTWPCWRDAKRVLSSSRGHFSHSTWL